MREEGLKMTVTSIKAAWAEVNKIFPSDYKHDPDRSDQADYPIYRSTAAGVNAWKGNPRFGPSWNL